MSSTVLLLPLWGRLGGGLRRLKAPIPTCPHRGKEQGLGAPYEP
jgi:hypothetical protein